MMDEAAHDTALVYSRQFLRHLTGPNHPERPERLGAVMDALRDSGLMDRLALIDPVPAELHHLHANHDPDYVRRVEDACRRGLPWIDSADSAICADSFEVARLAAGGVLAACDAVMAGAVRNAFCAVRPPGHHAERGLSMGFCLFNNVAIAARYLRDTHGVGRVAILDWDVHHGNGTQHAFEQDDAVLFCSVHQHAATCYPGTGADDEIGEGRGCGATLNLPVLPGWGDDEYREIVAAKALPRLREFDPDFILLSAGFDAHRDDPLAAIDLSTECFNWMGERVVRLAEEVCDGRLVSVLEGGYNLDRLAECVIGHVKRLLRDETGDPTGPDSNLG